MPQPDVFFEIARLGHEKQRGQLRLPAPQRRKADACFVVVADGTVLKWETALRKALLYVASKPFSDNSDASIKIVLTLFARHQKVSPSDLRHLEKALSMCNAKPYIYGEG